MPDEVLAGIVAKGIEESFFKKRQRGWGSKFEEYEPWVVEHIRKSLDAEVHTQVAKWIADNHTKVAEIVEKTLQGGIVAAVVRSMDATFLDLFNGFSTSIWVKLDEIRKRNP